jgi:hypothetical protein
MPRQCHYKLSICWLHLQTKFTNRDLSKIFGRGVHPPQAQKFKEGLERSKEKVKKVRVRFESGACGENMGLQDERRCASQPRIFIVYFGVRPWWVFFMCSRWRLGRRVMIVGGVLCGFFLLVAKMRDHDS